MVNHKRPKQDGAETPIEESQDGKRQKTEKASKFNTPYPLKPPSALMREWLKNDNSLKGYEKIEKEFRQIYGQFRDPESDLYAWMEGEMAIAAQKKEAKEISAAEFEKMRTTVWEKHYRWSRHIDQLLTNCANHCRESEKEDSQLGQRLTDRFEELRTHFKENFNLVKPLYDLDKYKATVVEIGDDKSDKFYQAWEPYREQMKKNKMSKKPMTDFLNDENTISKDKEKINEHLEYYSKMCKEIASRPKESLSIITLASSPFPSKSAFAFKESKLKSNSTLEDYKSFATELERIYGLYLDRKNKVPDCALYKWKAKELDAQIQKHPGTPEVKLRKLIDTKISDWGNGVDPTLLLCKEEVEEMGVRHPTLPVKPVIDQFEELRHLFFELRSFDLGKTLDTLDKFFKQERRDDRSNFKTTFEPCEYMLDARLKAQDITDTDKARILKFKQFYSEIKSNSRARKKRDSRKGEVEKNTNDDEEEQDHIDEDNQGVEEDEESNHEESNDSEEYDDSDGFDASAFFKDALGI